MDELLEQFLIEGRDLVAQASTDFERLSRSARDAKAIDSAFRAIHTLKGSVGIFAMQPAERVLHAAEDVLERARKGEAALDAATLSGLIVCLDAVDRWIDEIERAGTLSTDADSIAASALAALSGKDGGPSAGVPDWAMQLSASRSSSAGPLIAFRYQPDHDCFFRGDDPLAVIANVPELLELGVQPAAAAWPTLDTVEPFTCFSILQGISAAPFEAVQAAFRMMSDQVELHRIDAVAEVAPLTDNQNATSLRVDASRIDALADGLGELIVAVNGFAPLTALADQIDPDLAARVRLVQADIERCAGDLHRTVQAVRLVPLAPTLRRLPRLAREISEEVGKAVSFSIAGDRLEVDKNIADGLFEPLLHLLRNAIDHGIETAGVRAARGKRPEGSIALTASRDGAAIVIDLADDGGGIDIALVKQVAVTRGVITIEDADALSDAAAMRLIFAAGFTTADTITQVSGRGVGMDAVQAAVDRLRGSIEIESQPGTGTRFTLRLPANSLTTQLLVVTAGGDRYGVALDQIVETVRVDNHALVAIGAGLACVLRGKTVPVLNLTTLLGGTARETTSAKLLITRSGGEKVAIKVDDFAERIDTLVRPTSGLLATVPGVAGSSLLGDGGVLLVLDLPALAA